MSEAFIGPLSNPFWKPGMGGGEFVDVPIPISAGEITPDLLNRVIAGLRPGVKVESVHVVDAQSYGVNPEVVSSANRVKLRVRYTPDTSTANQLPTNILLKVGRTDVKIGPIYSNETRMYTRISPEADIEMPFCLGGTYDPETQRHAILMTDLTAAGARFPTALQETKDAHITALVDLLAKLHARYWNSPRFSSDLSWIENHVDSPLGKFMEYVFSTGAPIEAQQERVKAELVEFLGTTADWLVKGTKAVLTHQSKLPQTLCHGDAHIGNSYIYNDGRVGLCDWQLTSRGYCMFDVSYMIATSCSIEQRRRLERDLLKFYLERLRTYGVVSPPSFDEAWKEYRRAAIWGFWVGWVVTPIECYGLELVTVCSLRTAVCCKDLETLNLVAEVL
jgi:aminoglycoside phosphotransferase (APT) family kinase protein